MIDHEVREDRQISAARLAANRANAQQSTGPKTPEGKARSSRNARTLGLFVSDSTIAQEYPEEFAELLAGYVADYQPQGMIEFELVRQLTSATWRLRRFDRMETAAFDTPDLPETRHEASLSIAAQFEAKQVLMDRIYRARQQAERTFTRVYKELEARKARRSAPREVPDEIEIETETRHIPTRTVPLKAEVRPSELATRHSSLDTPASSSFLEFKPVPGI